MNTETTRGGLHQPGVGVRLLMASKWPLQIKVGKTRFKIMHPEQGRHQIINTKTGEVVGHLVEHQVPFNGLKVAAREVIEQVA